MLTQANEMLVIAHRGASAYAREHTLAAYDLALEMGADVLELDVRCTADNCLAVVHDRTLRRTTGDGRGVAEITEWDLLRMDPSLRPLLLEEVLERYGTSARYLVDLKEPRAPLERKVAAAIARRGLGPYVQVQTFSRAGLRRVHRCDPTLSLAQLYPPLTPGQLIRRDLARVASFANAVGPEAASVDLALVEAAHRVGLRVQPYTVNDAAEVERMLVLGVDALITDAPDRVRAAIGEELELALA